MSENTPYVGIPLDERPDSEKAKDWDFNELVTNPAPVVWREKSIAELRKTPIYNQGQSGSCVAQTLRKMIGMHVENETGVFVDPSATHIYQRRATKPNPGMGALDAFTIAQRGVTLEALAPSEILTDAQMDSFKVNAVMEEIGKGFAIGNFIEIKNRSLETVASTIQQTKKGIMSFHLFSDGLRPREWGTIPAVLYPNLPFVGPNSTRHSVAYTDFTLLGRSNLPDNRELWGKKALVADESWGLNSTIHGKRFITEEWFNSRCYYTGYFVNFKYQNSPIVESAKYIFQSDLELGMRNADVTRLQQFLTNTGDFPINQPPTGFFGNLTADAVGKFQVRNAIVQKGQAGYGRLGPATRGTINSGNFK